VRLRALVAVWVENIIVLDRALFLVESGVDVQFGCAFDPGSSPRCFMLAASKS
jgi:hypothetical protein